MDINGDGSQFRSGFLSFKSSLLPITASKMMSISPATGALLQVIGIDLGGSAIKIGRFDRQGTCLQSATVPTPQPPTPEAVLAALVEAIALVDPQGESQGIGIGTPGPADATGRIARVAINLGWRDVPLADWLEAKTGKPTILANDANCAGLGEYWLGAGKQFRDVLVLTLGTGVGGAVILDGKLFTGRHGTGGELGLITLNPEGPSCNSGNRGSLEQYTSVPAIRRRTGLEPDELGRRAAAGDPEAIAFWQQYGRDLGAGLASLVYMLTPEAILIGGGVSASAEFFFPAVQNELEQRVLPSSREDLHLLRAELGNQAGMVGAAKLAWEQFDRLNLVAVPPPSHAFDEGQRAQLAYHAAMDVARFKATFLARAAHELRSPINSAMSLHQLILSDLCDGPEEERDFVQQAQDAAKRMLSLLDEVIQVSRLEHTSVNLHLQPVQLVQLLGEVQQLLHLPAQNNSIQFTIAPPAPSTPELYALADPACLRQVLLHLINTPILLMREGSIRVKTAASPDAHHIHIDIEDDRPAETWHKPLLLLQLQEIVTEEHDDRSDASGFSPGMTLLIAKTLLELMQGHLDIVALPSSVLDTLSGSDASIQPTDGLTIVRCRIPLVVPEEP